MISKSYRQVSHVKKVEHRKRTVYVSGSGKDCVTKQVSDGWWVTFTDNPTGVRFDSEPDVQPGDVATCTWEFTR